ncbi:(2Fe-2S)-binding protein [Actinomadura sp. B10D3]|uniref:(2Fe-2S)-binding protein n=1 Tax=Actinomadura sp. B10D3 TaxID=3153557 RepID=UPI00325D00DA
MYVCICNAVTEDDVLGCMADGCTTAKAVKAACGFKPNCGSCTKRIHQMVSEYRTAGELADALTGGPLGLSAVLGPSAAEIGVPADAVTETAEGGAAPPTAA